MVVICGSRSGGGPLSAYLLSDNCFALTWRLFWLWAFLWFSKCIDTGKNIVFSSGAGMCSNRNWLWSVLEGQIFGWVSSVACIHARGMKIKVKLLSLCNSGHSIQVKIV